MMYQVLMSKFLISYLSEALWLKILDLYMMNMNKVKHVY